MTFYSLTTIIGAKKTQIPMRESTDSFGVAPARNEPYIEPTFSKDDFEHEKPAVLLISAVGATGKTALAQVLSNRMGLPLLDLSKHKPVGDNTLTGLLTSGFRVADLSTVFESLGQGTFAVIVDGIDEGRSKTTRPAFEAFLDDIVRLCRTAPTTSFVLLGRTQALEECWLYLLEQGVTTGLLTISPFDLDQARSYIDSFARGSYSSYAAEYGEVRDMILKTLAAAFRESAAEVDRSFLSFIGYPPVLDAIVTLLQKERNYHKLSEDLRGSDAHDVEIQLLHRIASYILRREKDQKIVPNILMPLVEERPERERQAIASRVFEDEEQCMRLVSHCLRRPLSLAPVGERLVDEKYEEQLLDFLPDHPFITDRRFRNAVFEAVALGKLILSPDPEAVLLALDYADTHKHNYHLVYLLHRMAEGRKVPISVLRLIVGSALEFRSRDAAVEIDVEGLETEHLDTSTGQPQAVEIQIDVIMGTANSGQSRSFEFRSDVRQADCVRLGHHLSSTYVILPCDILVASEQELEFTAPVEISANKITLQAPALVVRAPSSSDLEKHVLLEAETLEANLASIRVSGAELVLAVADRTGLTYPAIQHVKDKAKLPSDPSLKEKYLRLRRAFVHFRSHSRGRLAKYRPKVEHERVLGNKIGEAIRQRCLADGILTLEGSHYFLQPENVDRHLGVSWTDLREGRSSAKLEQYLRSIG